MTLLAELFDRLASARLEVAQPQPHALPPQAPAAQLPMPISAPSAEAASEPQRLVCTAANATPEWLAARDQYYGHAFACIRCHPPTGRYCPTGTALRATYDATPWI